MFHDVRSARLRYRPLDGGQLDDFHALARDPYVRRYLLDGAVVSREWSAARMDESQALFAGRGVGIWLARDEATDELVGFCGFLVIPPDDEPQLVYALLERFSGRGLGTEMARAAVAEARAHGRFEEILATVDAVNRASARVLTKLGFERIATRTEAFGPMLVLRLR